MSGDADRAWEKWFDTLPRDETIEADAASFIAGYAAASSEKHEAGRPVTEGGDVRVRWWQIEEPCEQHGSRVVIELTRAPLDDECERFEQAMRGFVHGLAAALPASPAPAGVADEAADGMRWTMQRETLGQIVRDAWIRWARTQPRPKPSWLVPYAELDEPDKEADRQIGETVAQFARAEHAAEVARLRAALERIIARGDVTTANRASSDTYIRGCADGLADAAYIARAALNSEETKP